MKYFIPVLFFLAFSANAQKTSRKLISDTSCAVIFIGSSEKLDIPAWLPAKENSGPNKSVIIKQLTSIQYSIESVKKVAEKFKLTLDEKQIKTIATDYNKKLKIRSSGDTIFLECGPCSEPVYAYSYLQELIQYCIQDEFGKVLHQNRVKLEKLDKDIDNQQVLLGEREDELEKYFFTPVFFLQEKQKSGELKNEVNALKLLMGENADTVFFIKQLERTISQIRNWYSETNNQKDSANITALVFHMRMLMNKAKISKDLLQKAVVGLKDTSLSQKSSRFCEYLAGATRDLLRVYFSPEIIDRITYQTMSIPDKTPVLVNFSAVYAAFEKEFNKMESLLKKKTDLLLSRTLQVPPITIIQYPSILGCSYYKKQ